MRYLLLVILLISCRKDDYRNGANANNPTQMQELEVFDNYLANAEVYLNDKLIAVTQNSGIALIDQNINLDDLVVKIKSYQK